jgi:hypothetical protein
MRVLLQDRVTRKYIREVREWTPFSWEALDFGRYEMAIAFARENQLFNIQIELGFIETGQKFHLPIEDGEKIGV